MVFKIVIGDKGKAWRLEVEGEGIVGKSLGEKIDGNEFSPELAGYELEITGGTDFAGFPMSKEIEGIGLKKLLKTKGWGMWDNTPGIRKRKTYRGKTISDKTVQINVKILKEGGKKLRDVFPDQNKLPEPEVKEGEVKVDAKVEEKPAEEKKDEVKEEVKVDAKVEEKPAEEKKDEVKEEVKK